MKAERPSPETRKRRFPRLHHKAPQSHTAINTILGLDLDKFKSVMCTVHPKTQETVPRTISTNPLARVPLAPS